MCCMLVESGGDKEDNTMMGSMASTAGASPKPRLIPGGRPTREERYRAQRTRAARLIAAGLWLQAVPAFVCRLWA